MTRLCRHGCRKRCQKCIRTGGGTWTLRPEKQVLVSKKDLHRARFRAEPVVCVLGEP